MKKYLIGFAVGIFAAIAILLKLMPASTPAPAKSSPANEASAPPIAELKNGDVFNLTASIVKKTIAGHEMKMLAYNGSIPGPTIKVAKGSAITIHFTNRTDVAT